jgi:hypothetical protein
MKRQPKIRVLIHQSTAPGFVATADYFTLRR